MDPTPPPDPGNAPPEDWTEDLTDEELEDVKRRLDEDA